VELDVMDIVAEVRATTAVTVAHAIQREVGPNGKVAIQQVMKGLTNAISMRDALINGEGKFDLISKCLFLLDAFTPPEGLAGREWIIKMREHARFTPDDNNLRKCQMDPERMIEQLTACKYILRFLAHGPGATCPNLVVGDGFTSKCSSSASY
jgi:hypothetical protein